MSERNRTAFSRDNVTLVALLLLLILVAFASLNTARHDVLLGNAKFWQAVAPSLALLGFIPLFIRARFSFGYLVGISFYCMMIGFFFLTYFTTNRYDVVLARWSALASLLMFLLPVLFQTRALPRLLTPSRPVMDKVVLGLLGLALVVLVIAAAYGFALVGLAESEALRGSFPRPGILNYVIGFVVSAVLPFAFAYFAWYRRYWFAGAAILLIGAYYPVALNKTVVFASLWLPYLFVMFRAFEPKRAAILALLLPMVPGIIAYDLIEYGWLSPGGMVGRAALYTIGSVNVRMYVFPMFAMNLYSEFFTAHPLTHFCQIGIIRAMYGCPYPFQLGAVMAEAYNMGNFNGSLFATEGLASVGPLFAPLSALACGLIVSLGNSASARLPAPLLATSAGIAVQALLNTPLSVSLLSNGVLVLWLLWALTPELPEDLAAP
jgi:uncharacterized membrane protein (Fun14 family)